MLFLKMYAVFRFSRVEIRILAKFHVSSITIRRDKFFDLMTF
jgi:hypothetical protein